MLKRVEGQIAPEIIYFNLWINRSTQANVVINVSHELLEKFANKRSELKYLSNFRKINQTRFYD